MNIPEFDMRVLRGVAECDQGWSRYELIEKYGPEALSVIDFLMENNLAKEYDHSLKPFVPDGVDYAEPPIGNIVATRQGALEVKRWSTSKSLSNRERWKERIFGFISGVAVTVIGGLILQGFVG